MHLVVFLYLRRFEFEYEEQNRCMFLNAEHEFTMKESDMPAPANDEILIKLQPTVFADPTSIFTLKED